MKLDPIPDVQGSQYMKLIVSLNFEIEVLNEKCDVMVKYFASGCIHCKNLKPIYERVAQKVIKAGNKIKFVEIDATANQIEDTVINSYPKLIAIGHLVSRNAKNEIWAKIK